MVEIALEVDHCRTSESIAEPLFVQLSIGNYDRCSVMKIPETIEEWRAAHRTARKRSDRAQRRGFGAANLERQKHTDDIYEINISASHRQGRPMSESYLHKQKYSPLPRYRCGRHAIRTSGVFEQEDETSRLRAYLVMHRAGNLALVSQILGHAANLDDEIMYLLFEYALKREIGHGTGFVVYNRHDSGGPGLRFYKERVGFVEERVEWAR